jgi:hypothetical protein
MKKKQYKETLKFDLVTPDKLGITEAGVTLGIKERDFVEYNSFVRENYAAGWKFPDTTGMVIPAGLELKEENFLLVPFRLLTATMVGAYSYKAAYFPAKVLRKAVPMLLGKGVFTNHDMDPNMWSGFVVKTSWEPEKIVNGETIPAGINGVLAIDTTIPRNKELAMGIVAGAVYSNSVSIEFMWEPSHKFANDNEFFWNLGYEAEDGNMIHRIATEVVNMHETSLVPLGADPYAKRLDSEGNAINVDKGSVYTQQNASASFMAEFNRATTEKSYVITSILDKNILSLTGKQATKPLFQMNEKTIKALIALFGLTDPNLLTEEHIGKFAVIPKGDYANFSSIKGAALAELKKTNPAIADLDVSEFMKTHTFVASAELANLQADRQRVTELTAQVSTLSAEKVALEVDAKHGKDHLEQQRELVKKFYRLEKGDKADETVVGLFDKASREELAALVKAQGLTIAGEFSYHCADCGSGKFDFRSSVNGAGEGDPNKTTTPLEIVTADDIREKRRWGK